MESKRPAAFTHRRLDVRMLGPLRVSRGGVALALPASRKARGLLAYLALAPRPVTRTHLCEILWDVPNDPRGELRWCLSKLRSLLDEPGRKRVETSGDSVKLDLADDAVDVLEIARAASEGIGTLPVDRLKLLSTLFAGEFLDGLEIDRSPPFGAWLVAQRRRFRAGHAAVLEHLVKRLPQGCDEVFGHVEAWLRLAPFDRQAHGVLFDALADRGRLAEGGEHLAATIRTFEAEGLSAAPIREAWQAARRRHATASTRAEVVSPIEEEIVPPAAPRRASIAVMPFLDRTLGRGVRGGLGDAIAYDVITRLAKLRSLFVIAQGTVLALDERRMGPEEAGRILNVDYVASGALQRRGNRVTVAVELAETRTARIVWAEVFDETLDDAFLVLDEIGNKIVASIASEIETAERNRAILKPPSSLDAWEAHHRGLWHMYRFNRADNERAQHFFETSIRLDPTFARAYAGLSFTHFQNAFQGWAERDLETGRAIEAAGRSLMVDDRDPAAHWAMGRALWLHGRQDQSLIELETSVELSPNFAIGHYALAFVRSQSGDPHAAIRSSDQSRHLSPFDPLLFAMLGTRAMALCRLGEFEAAADWSVKAAARPNAHEHVVAIAAHCLALAGRIDEARVLVASIRASRPHYRCDDFLAAFRFSEDAVALFRSAARRIGLA